MKKLFLFLTVMVLICAMKNPVPGEEPTLYGIISKNPKQGYLVSINTKTGAAQLIGKTGLTNPSGLAYSTKTDKLYAINRTGGGKVYLVNLKTGLATPLSSPGMVPAPGALAYCPQENLLYTNYPSILPTPPQSNVIYKLHPDTGAIVDFLGVVNKGPIEGMAVRPSDGILFGTNRDSVSNQLWLFTIAKVKGPPPRETNIGKMNVEITGLAFHPDGTLYSTDGKYLLTIDPTSGQTATVGAFGTNIGFVSGLAIGFQKKCVESFQITSTQPDKFEPNNAFAHATPVNLGQIATFVTKELSDLSLHNAADKDVFKIEYKNEAESECKAPSSPGYSVAKLSTLDYPPPYPPPVGTIIEYGLGSKTAITEAPLKIEAIEEYCGGLDIEIFLSNGQLFKKFACVSKPVEIKCPSDVFKDQKLFLRVTPCDPHEQGYRYNLRVTFSNRGLFTAGPFIFELREKLPKKIVEPFPAPPPLPFAVHYDVGEVLPQLEKYSYNLSKYIHKAQLAHATHFLGQLAHQGGLYEQAETYYRKSLGDYQEIDYKTGEADLNRSLGELFSSRRQGEQALAHFERASELHQSLGNTLGLAYDRLSLGRHYLWSEQPAHAVVALEEGLLFHRDTPDRYGQVFNLLYQSEAFLELNSHEAAMSCLILAEDMIHLMEEPELQAEFDKRVDQVTIKVGLEAFLELKSTLAGRAETVQRESVADVAREARKTHRGLK